MWLSWNTSTTADVAFILFLCYFFRGFFFKQKSQLVFFHYDWVLPTQACIASVKVIDNYSESSIVD